MVAGSLTEDHGRWSPRTRTRTLALASPGALIAVGYVDPGNWATDLAAGSRYGCTLLFVVVLSGLVAMLFQVLSARLGIAANNDLAALTRERYPRAAWLIWVAAEIAVVATDLAEVLGSGIALNLLFRIPLAAGVVLTGLDVLLLMVLERKGSRLVERVITSLMLVVATGLGYELIVTHPAGRSILLGLVPTTRLLHDRAMLLAAVAILGATLMPHNLYLHSRLAPQRFVAAREGGPRAAARLAAADTVRSLAVAIVLNGALMAIAAAAFHAHGFDDVATLGDAHRLLASLLGIKLAPLVFAVALLAAGQSATMTATMAGQVIMAGLLGIRWSAWKRRIVTRAFAIVPALAVIALCGEASTGRLLVLSQVVLSLQLPFAMVPLLLLTQDRRRMAMLVSPRWMQGLGWSSVAVVIAANAALVVTTIWP
ncbi:MAG: Nramp family divalent metal transporter [Myxococcota bacterium]|nr:Nramp family divalent metal transporter [Myxococcota bacterium]